MNRVDFYYDFSCPYAYLAHTQIDSLCERMSVPLTYKPFLLGAVFKAIGAADGPSMSPARARHNALDMLRWADHLGVPLRMPPTHPNRTVLALRAAITSSDLKRASKAIYAAYWVRGEDVSQPEVVRAALDAAGFDGAALLEHADEPAVKESLRQRTDEALAAGVFGAPAFVVHTLHKQPELFWGQDRLDFVEKALTQDERPTPSQRARAATPVRGVTIATAALRELEFYFDFSSPFAYLGSTQVEAVAARLGGEVCYKPFLLGALFKSIGTPDVPLFAMPEAKQRHYLADMVRWADHWGVPFSFPSRFPISTVKALRMVLEVNERRRASLVHSLYRAYWAEGKDISDDAILLEVTARLGFDGPALLAATREDRVKRLLRSATEEAEHKGVCGAPCFVVGGQLFWGQDRLAFVERALEGWSPRA